MPQFPNFVQALYNAAARRRRHYPAYTCRASELGGDCIRKMVYQVLYPNEATLPTVDLQLIFEEGQVHEFDLKIKIALAGIELIEQQVALSWKTDKFHITGHVDGVYALETEKGPKAIPVEIKSMRDSIWESIFKKGAAVYEWEEVKNGFQKKPWTRKYFGQILCYMLQKATDLGIFLCKNKSTGAIAQVEVLLDYEEGEKLLLKAEKVTEYIKAELLPEPIPFDPEVCGRCEFGNHCCPDQIAKPVAFTTEERIIELANQRWENKENRALYEQAHKKLSDWAKANEWVKCQVPGWFFEKKKHGRGMRLDIKPTDGEFQTVSKAEKASSVFGEK